MGVSETRTQGALVAALRARPRTPYRAVQCVLVAKASIFNSLLEGNRNGGRMAEDLRHRLASDFAQRLVLSGALTYPELPVLEAMQLKAHDLQEAGLLTEPQHHDLFMVGARDIPDESGRVMTPDELAAWLAADLVFSTSLFSLDELERLARITLDPGRYVAEGGTPTS
jgi:hypothetical protein